MKRAKLWPVSTVHPMQTESRICWVGSAGKGESWNAWTHQKPFYSNEKYTGPEIWHPTAASWSPHCCSDHRWASSSATCVGTKPHPTLSTHEKIHSSEILVITCRTPGFKTGKRSVWKRANKGGVVNFKCNSFQPSENWSSDEDSTNKPLEGVHFLMDRHNS